MNLLEENKIHLFVLATPIGNLKDLSIRAIETLSLCEVVFCEDTRVTKKILDHLGIQKNTVSLHHHTDQHQMRLLLKQMSKGKKYVYVTDAGTPGISDPIGLFIKEALEFFGDEIQISPIPGPSALTAALSISGFPTDRFHFYGFLPHKNGRKKMIEEISSQSATSVLFESTHRIEKTIEEFSNVCPDRKLVVCRELTKMYETILRGTSREMVDLLKKQSKKGEFVIVFSPK